MPRDLASIRRAIAQWASARPAISAAYVFGSTATGRRRGDSDVDVALLLARSPSGRRLLTFRLKLITELCAVLQRPDVDVVILNDASPLLAHRVLSKGRLVFERSPSARVRFQVKVAALYEDLIPMLETQIRYLKKHAREGTLVG